MHCLTPILLTFRLEAAAPRTVRLRMHSIHLPFSPEYEKLSSWVLPALQHDESGALKDAPVCDPTRPQDCLTYCYVLENGAMVRVASQRAVVALA